MNMEKIIRVQTLMREKDVDKLLGKTGERYMNRALNKAVEYYLEMK